MNIDVTIERIENGFLVIDKDGRKRYYESMRKFTDLNIGEAMDEADKYFREHKAAGELRRLRFSVADASAV